MAPKVDRRGRAEGVEFAGFRRERGGKHHGEEESDQAVRELRQDKRDEDVVGILRLLGCGVGRLQRVARFVAHGERGFLRSRQSGARGGFRRSIAALVSRHPRADFRLFVGVQHGVFLLDGTERGALRTVDLLLPHGLVEEDGRAGLELVKHEEQRTEDHDEELHRDLQDRVEHQTEATLAQARTTNVALHLGLVGAEVGQREEKATEDTGPHRVAELGIGREIDGVELAHRTGNVERVRRKLREQHHERGDHAAEDHGHLPFLREVDRRAATGDSVNNGEQARADDGDVEPPAEDGRENDGGRVDRDARLQTALQHKETRTEEAGLLVETLAEVFVGRIHPELPIDREKDGTHDDEGERQAKIILDEGDAVFGGDAG